MALLKVKTSFATYNDCFLKVDHYRADNALAVLLFNKTEGPIATLTVCLCDSHLKENESYVDTNNCPWVVDFLEGKGLAIFTGKVKSSGFCVYPAMEFDLEKMKEFEEE